MTDPNGDHLIFSQTNNFFFLKNGNIRFKKYILFNNLNI